MDIIKRIRKHLERSQTPRDYLGASCVGHPCDLYLYKSIHTPGMQEYQDNIKLTFQIGHSLEAMLKRLIKDSLSDKYELQELDELVCQDVPILKGHVDGVIVRKLDYDKFGIVKNTPDEKWLLEIKTAKNSSFSKLEKSGYRQWSEQYWAQLHTYLGMSKIDKAIVLVINKDTSALYQEDILLDPLVYKQAKQRVAKIVDAHVPPERLSSNPGYYICKMCSFHKVCHGL